MAIPQVDAIFGYARGHHIIYEDNIIEAIKHVKGKSRRGCGCGHPNCTGSYEHTDEVKLIENDLQSYIEDHYSFIEALTAYNKR